MITSEHTGEVSSLIEDDIFVWGIPSITPMWIVDQTPMHIIDYSIGLPDPRFTITCECNK